MKIYIPTFKRPNKQITFNNLPDEVKKDAILVVQEQEKDEYNYDCEYLVVGNNIGIAKTRAHIYEHAKDSRFCMYDDDVKFIRRNAKYYGGGSNMEKSSRVMTADDFDEMFSLFNSWMDDGYVQIGQNVTALPPSGKKYTDFTSFNSVHYLDGSVLQKEDIDHEFVQVGEDYHLMLELLTRGYKTRRSDEFVISVGENYAEGGCSTFRTPELQYNEHIKLIKKFPGLVYIAEEISLKNNKTVTNFRYKLKDAYKSSKVNNSFWE